MTFPTGVYNVGCIDIMTPATKIPSDLSPESLCSEDTDLGLLTCIYYPCIDDVIEAGYEQKHWMLPRHRDWYCYGMMHQNSHRSLGFIASFLTRNMKQEAWEGAPLIERELWIEKQQNVLLKENGKLPLVVLSHGLNAHRSMYSVFCTQLASEGFLVVAIEHRDGSACASFIIDESENDVEIPYLLKDTDVPSDEDRGKVEMRKMQLKHRTKELSKLLDLISILNSTPEDINNMLNQEFDLTGFKGIIDVENPMVMGHSFGGTTVLSALLKESRFKCGISLDPWSVAFCDEFYQKDNGNKRPLLAIMTELWKWDKNVEKMKKYSQAQPEGFCEVITLSDGGHCDQCDLSATLPWWFPVFEKGMFGNKKPADVMIDAQRKIISAYYMKYLKDKSFPLGFVEENRELLKDGFTVGYNMQ